MNVAKIATWVSLFYKLDQTEKLRISLAPIDTIWHPILLSHAFQWQGIKKKMSWKDTAIMPTKSDSDEILCLQLLSKTLTHFNKANANR